ncbi:hypothetical protein EDB85DRAFT_1146338 [Lactarius pseudohatsudake]|nr:hypothetical protein EDB85DRAFT_1146338 [Lactarius pseudohatsudake]
MFSVPVFTSVRYNPNTTTLASTSLGLNRPQSRRLLCLPIFYFLFCLSAVVHCSGSGSVLLSFALPLPLLLTPFPLLHIVSIVGTDFLRVHKPLSC